MIKTIDQEVFDFIEDQEHFELMLRNGIIISVSDDNILEAECILSDSEDARLILSFQCEPKGFVKGLGIKALPDIYALSTASLMEAYYEGLADIICMVSIEYTYFMTFQTLGNRTVAENERGFKHTIPLYEKIETPGQFIAYAKRYYSLMECSEN